MDMLFTRHALSRRCAALMIILGCCTACSTGERHVARDDHWFDIYQEDPATMQNPAKQRLGPIDRAEPF
jgi:hypothetical protein